MTTANPPIDSERVSSLTAVVAFIRREGWVLGLFVLLALLLVFTKIIEPDYNSTGLRNLAINSLPLALAAVAQAVVVISGGIDLSIGSMMALTSVVAATQFQGQSNEVSIAVAVGVLLLGVLIGAINGAIIVATRVTDIIVTLAMSFVWAGAALLVLRAPGGFAPDWLIDLVSGSLGSEWIPRAAVVLLVLTAIVWIPLKRSRMGLALYAVGSNQLAAFRSGVSVGRAKITAYAIGGLFSAMAGMAIVATNTQGDPVPGGATLTSVAAVVLGGVALAGGRGGVFGPILAVLILAQIRTDLTFLGINSNLATVAQGVILITVVMIGSLVQLRRSRA
jgi:ribose transport system permease protein